MIEVFINAVKLLVSPDARTAGSAIVDLIRRTPEWQKGIAELEVHVSCDAFETAHLIRDLCVEKLQTFHYPSSAIAAFGTVFEELSRNAIEHGCVDKTGAAIAIVIASSKTYVSLQIRNAKGIKFNLSDALLLQRTKLTAQPSASRGRGLLMVDDLADEFSALPRRDGVKAVVYADRVELHVFENADVAVVALGTGLFNPSCVRRVETMVRTLSHPFLILDFTSFTSHDSSSVFIGTVLRLEAQLAASDRRLLGVDPAVSVPSFASYLPKGVFFRSLEEALASVQRDDLAVSFKHAIEERRRAAR